MPTLLMYFNINSVIFTVDNIEEKKNLLKIILMAIISLSMATIAGLISKLYYRLSNQAKLMALSKLNTNNPLESLVLISYIQAFPVLVTLSSNKVYVGLIPSAPLLEDGKLEYFCILPLLSGYRRTDDLQIKFTTNYYSHYDTFLGDSDLAITDFNVTIPINEIITVPLFDLDTYNKFENNNIIVII